MAGGPCLSKEFHVLTIQAPPLAVLLALGTIGQIGLILLGVLLACLVGGAILAVVSPNYFFRVVLWLPAHLIYRIKVSGSENIPRTGGVLYVSNHVSFIDAALIFLSQPRPIHYVIWAGYTHGFLLGTLFRMTRALAIDGSSGPRALVRSLGAVSDMLAKGEAVCIFAEGGITRTGFLLPFHRGLEQILKKCPAPIVPVCLDGVWGSVFSYRGGRFFWKWPQAIPYPVAVKFGEPLAATTPAYLVRRAIQKLSADCAITRASVNRPVHRQFLRMASKRPWQLCFVDFQSKREYSYGQALVGARLLARALKPILKDDQMIGLWLPPSVGGALANIALSFLGKVPVNLNYSSSPEVVHSCMRQCNMRHVVTARAFVHRMPFPAPEGTQVHYLEDFARQFSSMQKLSAMLQLWLLPRFVMEHWVLGLGSHKPQDLAVIIFSSGSTGDPKGIMLTHANLTANAESIIQGIDPGPQDRLFGVLPFFHSFGYTVTLWLPLQVGASAMFYPDPRQGKEIGELCKNYGATLYLSTPTFLRFCLRRCAEDDFRTLRLLIVGAEKMPPSLALEFKEKFGVLPLEGYGCTELSPAAIINVPDWEHDGIRQIGNRPGSIGQPLPGVAAKTVHAETGAELGPGEDGMLLVYGANVMQGYLGKPALTQDSIRDGWYVTGDIAHYDEDGFFTITDRLARFSKIGGEMVPHQKVEDELQLLIGSTDRVFTVTALPDERKGERLVVLHTKLPDGWTVESLWRRLNERGLPSLWVPSQRDFFEIQEMPVLGSGKMDFKKVKEIAVERSKPEMRTPQRTPVSAKPA